MAETYLIFIAGILTLGILAQWIAWKFSGSKSYKAKEISYLEFCIASYLK